MNIKTQFYIGLKSNSPGQLKWIDKKQIVVCPDYQRSKPSPNTIKSIRKNWNWLAFGALMVAERDGVFYVVDGQHRLLAAMQEPGVQQVPCVVYPTHSIAIEAKSFLEANTSRVAVSAIDKYKAALAAKEHWAINMQLMLEELDIVLVENPKEFRQTCVVSAITRQIKVNVSFCQNALSVAIDATKSENSPIKETIFAGLCYLEHNLQAGSITDARFRSKVATIGATAQHRAAVNTAVSLESGGNTSWGRGILNLVNKGAKNKYQIKERSSSQS